MINGQSLKIKKCHSTCKDNCKMPLEIDIIEKGKVKNKLWEFRTIM